MTKILRKQAKIVFLFVRLKNLFVLQTVRRFYETGFHNFAFLLFNLNCYDVCFKIDQNF